MKLGPITALAGLTSMIFVPAMIVLLIINSIKHKPRKNIALSAVVSNIMFDILALDPTEDLGAIVLISHILMLIFLFTDIPRKFGVGRIDSKKELAVQETQETQETKMDSINLKKEEISSLPIETASIMVDVSKDHAPIEEVIKHEECQTEIEVEDLTPSESSTLVFTRDDIFGRTIEDHYDYYRALKNIKSVDIDTVGGDLHTELIKIDSMDGLTFERYTANLLTLNGFVDAKTTQSTNDYGVDVIAFRHGDKYAIQCKNYSSTLGNSPVQEVYTGMTHYDASKAAVITNSYFTENAKKLAVDNSVELWDRDVLIKFIDNAIPKVDKMDQAATPEEMEYSNLFNESVEYTLTKLNISTSDLQRTFDITFLESTKLFNDLRALGIIENLDSLRPSNVIITPEAISDRFYRYKI